MNRFGLAEERGKNIAARLILLPGFHFACERAASGTRQMKDTVQYLTHFDRIQIFSENILIILPLPDILSQIIGALGKGLGK